MKKTKTDNKTGQHIIKKIGKKEKRMDFIQNPIQLISLQLILQTRI